MAYGKRKRTNSSTKSNVKRRKKTKQSTKRKRAKAATASQYLTDQYDKRVDFVAIKKPNQKLKKELKFKAMVQKAIAPHLPTVTKLYTTVNTSVTNTGSTDQCYIVYHMRPYDGQSATPGTGTLYNEPAQNDLKDIASELTAGLNVSNTDKFANSYVIKSSVMDIYVEAVGTTDCVFDVYEIVYQKKAGNPINQQASLTALLLGTGYAPTSGATNLNIGVRGVTPFDMTQLVRDFGIKVIKKSTNFVQGGAGGFTYTVKDYRKQEVDNSSMATDLNSKFCVQGFTKSILIVGKTLVADSSTVTGFRATRECHYRIQPMLNQYAANDYSGQN